MKCRSPIPYIAPLIIMLLVLVPCGKGDPWSRQHVNLFAANAKEAPYVENSPDFTTVPFVVFQKTDDKPVTNLKKENVAIFVDDVQTSTIYFEEIGLIEVNSSHDTAVKGRPI